MYLYVVVVGTLLAGISVLCCSRPRFVHLSRSSVLCLNAWVGLLQLLTTILLLFGWVWSIVWAANFITVSSQSHQLSQLTQTHSRRPMALSRSLCLLLCLCLSVLRPDCHV